MVMEMMPLVHQPVAGLQIVISSEVVKDDQEWLDRSKVEPTLWQNADGLWLLSVRRQGEHRKFAIPFIGSEIVLALPDLVAIVVGYHGASVEKYGRLGYMTQKGQFWRYYRRSGEQWTAVQWREFPDELRQVVLDAPRPEWARVPGKLASEHKPPTRSPRVTLTTYKVVRVIEGRYYSLYDPTQEYVLGEKVKQPAKPGHRGGFFSYPTLEQGMSYLEDCVADIPFHSEIFTPHLALLECEASGKCIDYGRKYATTYLLPLKVLETRCIWDG